MKSCLSLLPHLVSRRSRVPPVILSKVGVGGESEGGSESVQGADGVAQPDHSDGDRAGG